MIELTLLIITILIFQVLVVLFALALVFPKAAARLLLTLHRWMNQ